MRAILPPLVGQVITTFKDSALASLISLPDLTFQALEVMAISRMTFEVWISAGGHLFASWCPLRPLRSLARNPGDVEGVEGARVESVEGGNPFWRRGEHLYGLPPFRRICIPPLP